MRTRARESFVSARAILDIRFALDPPKTPSQARDLAVKKALALYAGALSARAKQLEAQIS
jgi:hypothetical protein